MLTFCMLSVLWINLPVLRDFLASTWIDDYNGQDDCTDNVRINLNKSFDARLVAFTKNNFFCKPLEFYHIGHPIKISYR